MTLRVDVKPELLTWAIERSGRDRSELAKKFQNLDRWLAGTKPKPTFKQIEDFAKATYTPSGYFYLNAPPDEKLSIPDYRTMASVRLARPSANLLDTIYVCQQRQEWYRDHARSNGFEPLDFIGSVTTETPTREAARLIREKLRFDLDARRAMRSRDEVLNSLVSGAEAAGVLVMRSGMVLNNTRRKLDPKEFRGFALVDKLAPVVFVNGAAGKSTQMSVLVRGLAYLWLGRNALLGASAVGDEKGDAGRWCEAAAEEMLAPLRISDARSGLEKPGHTPVAPEGCFRLSVACRASRGFVAAVIESTLEGRTLYRDALRLLGLKRVAALKNIGRGLGVVV